MKLNNKGFAISSIMYMILVLAVVLISLILAMLSSRRLILEKLKSEVYNDIYNTPSISYRKVLTLLKEDAINYATSNSIQKVSIKISDINSSISSDILEKYDLSSKYITVVNNSNNYDAYLGESQVVTAGEEVTNMIDIIDYKIYGNSYQEISTQGKNLFDITKVISKSNIINNDDGTLSVTAITSSSGVGTGQILSELVDLEVGKTYTLSAESTGKAKRIYLSKSASAWRFGDSRTITQDDLDSTVYWYANGDTDTTFTATVSKIQIEEGTNATSYENFKPNKPSLEHPSEVIGVGDYDELTSKYVIPVTVGGKNLFDVNDFIETYSPYFSINKPMIKEINGEKVLDLWGGVNANGRALEYMKGNFKENTQYTISLDIYDIFSSANGLHGAIINVMYTDGSYSHILGANRVNNEWNSIKFTTPKNKSVSHIYMTYNTGGGESYIKNFQIEEGIQVTDYESYIDPVTTNIYLDEPLRKIDNYSDYIDLTNTKIINKIGKYEITGNENWISYSSSYPSTFYMLSAINTIYSPNIKILSNQYMGKTSGSGSTWGYGNIWIQSTDLYPRVYINDKNYKNIDNFTKTLIDKYISGTPVSLYYPLLTESEKELNLSKIKVPSVCSKISIDTSLKPSNYEFTVVKKIIQI